MLSFNFGWYIECVAHSALNKTHKSNCKFYHITLYCRCVNVYYLEISSILNLKMLNLVSLALKTLKQYYYIDYRFREKKSA